MLWRKALKSVASALAAGAFAAAALAAPAIQAQEGNGAGRVAVLVDLEGVIGPPTTHLVEQAIKQARERDAEVLILRLNTPGGLATSMREIITQILDSPVPVVGYVAPAGGRAASAGTYILYATHVAAMAPGTNVGAATPVQMGGGFPGSPSPGEEEGRDEPGRPDGKASDQGIEKDRGEGASREQEEGNQPGSAMERKAVNDAVAYLRSLAELRGRNVEWAEKAVRQAASLSAVAAVEQNVVDLLASDVDSLLQKLDGRTVEIDDTQRTLATAGLPVERIEPSLVTRLLGIVTNPNVAFLLLMIGVYGLIFEFANPGSIGPGVVGVICLLLGLYALNQLPLDYAGLALMVLGVALLVAEAFTPTFGVLGVGGLAAFVIGSAMLIDTDIPAYQISWPLIAGVAVVSGLILTLLVGYVWRSHQRAVVGGVEPMIGGEARVLEWSGRQGYVVAAGERWRAVSEQGFAPGETVRVRRLEGLTLTVESQQESQQ